MSDRIGWTLPLRSAGRSGRLRRDLGVAVSSGEGPLTEATADAQCWPRELVFRPRPHFSVGPTAGQRLYRTNARSRTNGLSPCEGGYPSKATAIQWGLVSMPSVMPAQPKRERWRTTMRTTTTIARFMHTLSDRANDCFRRAARPLPSAVTRVCLLNRLPTLGEDYSSCLTRPSR
jgi:hypothetical protein